MYYNLLVSFAVNSREFIIETGYEHSLAHSLSLSSPPPLVLGMTSAFFLTGFYATVSYRHRVLVLDPQLSCSSLSDHFLRPKSEKKVILLPRSCHLPLTTPSEIERGIGEPCQTPTVQTVGLLIWGSIERFDVWVDPQIRDKFAGMIQGVGSSL